MCMHVMKKHGHNYLIKIQRLALYSKFSPINLDFRKFIIHVWKYQGGE